MTSLSFDIFARDNSDEAFKKLSRNLKNNIKDFDDFGTRGAASFAKAANSLSNLSTGIAVLQSVGQAASNLSGVLGLIPAAALDAGAAFATLAVGTHGFADGLKEFADTSKISKGASGVADAAVQAARRIESAEKTLAGAQRASQDAQDNLRRAREHAADQLIDLNLALRGASLSEEDAAIGLERAQQRLADAQKAGATGLDLREAQLGVKQASLAVDEAKDKFAELSKEAAHANKVGVDGSDEVVAAQRQVADAAQAVRDAQEQVARAHEDAARAADKAGASSAAATAKFNALAGSAQETIRAIAGLGSAWKDVQQSVQGALFAGLGEEVNKLGGVYLPVLRIGMTEVAGEFNKGAHSLADFLAEGEQVNTVKTIFASTRDVTGTFALALRPLVSILLDVASVGAGMLPGLTSGFANAAESASLFVRNAKESGQLQAWIQKGLDTLKKLAELLGNIGSIVATVFKGLSSGGKDFLGTLLSVTGQIKTFLQSFEGQQALKALGSALQAVASVVTSVLLEAFKQLAPIIVQLAPGFAELARQIGDVLVAGLKVAGPLLQAIAKGLSDNIEWLGPLALGLIAGAKAFAIINAALALLKIEALSNPWLAIIAATIALVILIVTHWDQVKAILAAAWEWIKKAAAVAWEAIKNFIVDPVVTAAKWIGDKVGAIVQWFIDLPGRVWSGLKSFASGIKSAIIDPIVNVVRWVGEQVGNIIQWFKDLPGKIGNVLAGLGDVIRGAFRGALNFLIDILNGFIFAVNLIITGVNAISPFDDIPQIQKVPKLHAGGIVPGRPGQESLFMLEAGERVIPASGGGAGGGDVHVHFHGPVGSSQQLENWLVEAVDKVRRRGRLA